MRKRVLSALLAACLLAGLLPVAVAAEHTHEGRTAVTMGTTYIKLGETEQESNTLIAGSYYLDADLAVPLTVDGAVELCLNGHSVTCDSANAVTVPAGASLTLTDCVESSTGKVAYTGTGSSYYAVSNAGTFILESGAVESVYRGVYNGSNAVFIMTGGTVTADGESGYGVYNSSSSSVFKLSGGSVTGGRYGVCNYYSGSQVYLSGNASVSGGEGYADIYTDDSSSYIYADDGAETDAVPYSGGNVTLKYSYLSNGYPAVLHVTEATKDKFTLKSDYYSLAYDGENGALTFQGNPQALTWYGEDETTPLTGDDYPAEKPYDTTLKAADLPAAPAVEGKLFLGWLYRDEGDTDWSEKCWSDNSIYGPTRFKALYVDTFPGGSGTESDPYQIAAADDLAKLRTIVDSGNTTYNSGGVWYQLTADIDLSGLCGPDTGSWTPIGGGSYPFRANLDGGGKTISNLYLGGGRYDSYQGLFGYLKGEYSGQTTVKDLTLADVSVSSGGSYIGALAGRALYVNITGCTVTGAVSGESDYGALVGKDDGGGTLENNDVSGVALSPYGYTLDENRTMAYQVSGSKSTTIDIKGSYKGSWLKTTYSDEGYAVATSGLDSAAVTAEADFVNGGKYIRLSYTVTAGDTAIAGGKLAVHADVKIGENDQAAVEAIQDAAGQVIGLKMVDDKAASSSYDAQFNLYFDGTGGVTAVDTWWFGYYSDRNGHYYDQLTDSTKSSGTYETNDDGVYTRLSGVDSGFAVSWQNIDLAANESATFSFILGVGEKADPPAWSAENAVSLTLAADVEQNNRLVNVSAKVQDASGLTDTLYYSVNGGEETVLGSVAADGTQKDITGQLDLSGYALGQYTFSFWVVNSKGAASPSVERIVTVTADGVEGLDAAPSAPEHVHSWATAWSADDTHHWHECEAEGCDVTENSQKDGYGEHTWDDGAVTTPATYDADGVKTYTCTVCGQTKTEAVPMLTHHFSTEWTADESDHWHICTDDGCDAISDKAAHTWNDGEITIPATCTEPGVMTYTCTICDATKAEDIDPTGHTEEIIPGKAATCTEPGFTEGKKCSVCGQVLTAQEEIPATGHTYGDYQHDEVQHWRVCGVCDTETEKEGHVFDDEQDTECNVCGYTRTVTPVEPEPVEPDPVEPEPVEPDPVEPEPVEPDPVEPDPVEPTPGHGGGGYVAPRAVIRKTADTAAETGPDTADTADNSCPKDGSCPVARFTDADATEWYHDGVHYCVEQGLMVGTSETTFEPETATSRAMLATILWRQAGSPVVNYALQYDDVEPGSWYTEAIRWATAQGVVKGYGNGKFGPGDPITREQLATMLYRYEQLQGGGFAGSWMFLLDFTDRAEVSEWAYEAVCYMTMHSVMEGKGNKILDPQGQATRAEAATMLQRFCGKEK